MNRCCLVRIVTHHCPYRPCSTRLLKTAMTRIVHGIQMMKGIMLTSSLHHIAPWQTIPDHWIPVSGKHGLYKSNGKNAVESKYEI